jgi:hypothetical protein
MQIFKQTEPTTHVPWNKGKLASFPRMQVDFMDDLQFSCSGLTSTATSTFCAPPPSTMPLIGLTSP